MPKIHSRTISSLESIRYVSRSFRRCWNARLLLQLMSNAQPHASHIGPCNEESIFQNLFNRLRVPQRRMCWRAIRNQFLLLLLVSQLQRHRATAFSTPQTQCIRFGGISDKSICQRPTRDRVSEKPNKRKTWHEKIIFQNLLRPIKIRRWLNRTDEQRKRKRAEHICSGLCWTRLPYSILFIDTKRIVELE